MKYIVVLFFGVFLFTSNAIAQQENSKEAIKLNLNNDGSRYIQFTLLNQTWLRFNESNAGTLVMGEQQQHTLDIGLRRTRFQVLGQITDNVFIYFQFGENNFNSMFNAANGNRKLAAFFHDALCEYKVSKKNELKLGGGLTIANGLSRFSQPSIGTIATMDVPVFAQTTVDQIDEFSRKLSIYARGQIGKFDYRFILSDPFPVTSSGTTTAPLTDVASFAQKGHRLQTQAYVLYQFFEHEPHTTPYMAGTYLGKKKIFNVAAGFIYQPKAMWLKKNITDTSYNAMQHFAIESFLDLPLNSKKQNAINAYIGYFKTNYGSNYLRYNGIMNPANGTSLTSSNSLVNHGATYGNAYPMFGTGTVLYFQAGYLLPISTVFKKVRLMPYASATMAKYERLNGLSTNTYNAGVNYFINAHKAKFTLDWQNRDTYLVANNVISKDARRNTVTLQYQIFF